MLLTVASGSLGPAQRKRLRLKHWMHRIWFLGKCGTVVVLGVALVWGGYTVFKLVRDSGYLRLRNIHITGHNALSRNDILYLLAIPDEVSLLQLDLTRMGARLERHPQVQTVMLHRQFPDTLRVTIQERVPRLVVVSGTQHMVVDREGVVIRSVNPTGDQALTRLHLSRKPALSPAMQLRQAEVRRALELIRAYEDSELAGTLRVVSLTVQDSGESRWTVDPYPFTLRVGEGRVDEQLKRLPPVLQYLQHRDLAVRQVDVSYRKRVVVIPET
jgi:cell division protein FtsQ